MKVNATTRRRFDRSMDTSLIFQSVLALISQSRHPVLSLAEVRSDGHRRFVNDISIRILDRLKAEHPAEFLQ